ncbi:AhpC/TSA family protein [Zhouia spongiae]|uniref:AhpC/TSA family protein n=1 Tax=Zhouia spongiae TaxID=2202721 RepID=A0ABY3YKH2_9FLAO|nr:TlpA disulfide reductase family protein [Zhouia spongiae]UNY98094.1 AhpC/TSA family protein [Zhouia spongiae]
MKKLAFLILAVVITACNGVEKNTYNVTVDAASVKDSTNVYLQKAEGNTPPQIIDTLQVIDGKITFSGKAETPSVHVLAIEGTRGAIPFIAEEGNINIIAYKDSLNASVVSGTSSNDDFTKFLQGTKEMAKKVAVLRQEFNTARQQNDTISMKTLQEAFADIQEENKEYELNFIKENPNSFISLLVMERVLQSGAHGPEVLSPIFDTFAENLKQMEQGQKISEKLTELNKLSVGAIAPDFTAPTVEGDSLTLSKTKGKVTLIDFWAAWCKPCRAENPNVVALYNDYHDKGLNIIGVSLDRKEEDWIKAIEDDGLTWNHVSNLKFWQDPVAQLYNIRSIPATYLIDAEGKIIAKNLRGEALRTKVAELLD